MEVKIKNAIPLTITQTENGILRCKSNKISMNLNSENYEMLIREIKEVLNRCSWIGSLNIVKMSVLSKLIHRFNAIPINIQAKIIFEREQSHCPWFKDLIYSYSN